jgi:putative ATP-dependent endonuclease of OLD family
MMTILRAMGFAPKALADLDFAFKVAPNVGLIAAADPDIAACKAWFAANAGSLNVFLGGDGLPTKHSPQGVPSALKPAAAFKQMALANQNEVARIAANLRVSDIWIWAGGAIEAHLGIGKTDAARIGFINAARQSGNLNHAVSPQGLEALANWM